MNLRSHFTITPHKQGMEDQIKEIKIHNKIQRNEDQTSNDSEKRKEHQPFKDLEVKFTTLFL